jgi:putative transcriptional regulator
MNSISTIRRHLGVTQAAMAEGLCVTQGNVSNYEKGQTVPPDVAKLLIAYAASRGMNITFNDVYASSVELATPSPTPPASAAVRKRNPEKAA